jgi:hypothetical protein
MPTSILGSPNLLLTVDKLPNVHPSAYHEIRTYTPFCLGTLISPYNLYTLTNKVNKKISMM